LTVLFAAKKHKTIQLPTVNGVPVVPAPGINWLSGFNNWGLHLNLHLTVSAKSNCSYASCYCQHFTVITDTVVLLNFDCIMYYCFRLTL